MIVPAARSGRRPARVLLVERTIGFGGSTVGLAQIVRGIDRSRFTPLAIVSHESLREFLRERAPDVAVAVIPARAPRPAHPGAGPIVRAMDSACGVVDGWRRDGSWADAAERVARPFAPDLIHLNNGVSSNSGGIAVAQRLGVPCVVKQRGFEWRSWGVRRLAERVAHYLPDSASLAADLVRVGAPRDRMTVTYCAVDPDDYRGAHDRDAVRASLGVPPGAPCFGIVGQLLAWKGQTVFLDAAARVLAMHPHARAVIVGATPAGTDDPYAQSLRERAARLRIADRVTFAGHRRDVPAVLGALDVVVHASVQPEPFGTIVAEALAAGRPVVASRAGGPCEYVEHGRTGLLAEPGDAEDLASAILRHLADPAAARAMADAGRAVVLRRFSVARHVALTEAAWDAVLARGEDASGRPSASARHPGSARAVLREPG